MDTTATSENMIPRSEEAIERRTKLITAGVLALWLARWFLNLERLEHSSGSQGAFQFRSSSE